MENAVKYSQVSSWAQPSVVLKGNKNPPINCDSSRENYSIVNRDRQQLERRGDVAIVTSIQVLMSAVEASLGVSSIRLLYLTGDGTQDTPGQRLEEMLCPPGPQPLQAECWRPPGRDGVFRMGESQGGSSQV